MNFPKCRYSGGQMIARRKRDDPATSGVAHRQRTIRKLALASTMLVRLSEVKPA